MPNMLINLAAALAQDCQGDDSYNNRTANCIPIDDCLVSVRAANVLSLGEHVHSSLSASE
jgi:hypothetical protein